MNKEFVFSPADILLPKSDFEKWAVIACDQYTSEPEYWEDVKRTVGDAPSTLNIVFPEVYLGDKDEERIETINSTMQDYINNDLFTCYENSLFYTERTQSDGTVRHGIIGKIDLAQYDFNAGATSAVRATEKTILERIPPRVKIRENASLELPHILLLIDDPDLSVIEPLTEKVQEFETVYDFKLMQNGGYIKGWQISREASDKVIQALKVLETKGDGLVFCVGDGNHSLATAKTCYEQNPNEYNRYALVEVLNIHDSALGVEPIYRAVFGCDCDTVINDFVAACGGEYNGDDAQHFTCVTKNSTREISVKPTSEISVGTLQSFLDDYMKSHPEITIDFIHGEQSLKKICEKENTVGFLFEGMRKSELFPAVINDGSLPRKTFSMGHADDKRFYLEARIIK